MSGRYVIILTDIVIYDWLMSYNKRPDYTYLKIVKHNDLYISKDCGAVIPYTLILSANINHQLEKDLNTMYEHYNKENIANNKFIFKSL